jgi:plasmid maintenance system killer protein
MIRSFKHPGLKRLYERGDRSGIQPDLVDTVQEILSSIRPLRRRRLIFPVIVFTR